MDRLDGVFGKAVALKVPRADHELGVGLARAGGESEPAGRLVEVLGDARPSRCIEPRTSCATGSPCAAARRTGLQGGHRLCRSGRRSRRVGRLSKRRVGRLTDQIAGCSVERAPRPRLPRVAQASPGSTPLAELRQQPETDTLVDSSARLPVTAVRACPARPTRTRAALAPAPPGTTPSRGKSWSSRRGRSPSPCARSGCRRSPSCCPSG